MKPGGSDSGSDAFLERRLAVAALLIALAWGLILLRLFYVQIARAEEFASAAERNSVRSHRVPAPRGMILDRGGEVLVDSRPSYKTLVVPHKAGDLDWTASRLADVLAVDRSEIAGRIGAPRGSARFQPLEVARDLERGAFARLQARLWALPGVVTQVDPVRRYRYGDSAAHVLGRLGEIDADRLGRREYRGYRRGDVIGREGVEALLDRDLRGRPGGLNVLVDARGREIRTLSAVEAEPGLNVVLTLDRRLQQVAERGLDDAGRGGAVVALDPRSGAVLVLASRPAFDPNRFATGIGSEGWAELSGDERAPLNNRAIRGQYPPGSTYKLVAAIAALEERVATPDTRVTCRGSFRLGSRRYRCWKREGHGPVGIHAALVRSCDVFFYEIGRKLGPDRLAHYARELGLGVPTGLDVPGESAGLVPTRAWKERRFGEPWLEGETVSLSIGQGFNLWTPIQLAAAYAAVGNGGTRYRPFLVERIETPAGEAVRERGPEVAGELPIRRETLEIVRAALRGAVHEPGGTGSAMRRVPGVESAGKTGTAQVVGWTEEMREDEEAVPERFRDHAWFATWLPADEPRLVVAVLVEHGGHGGSAAAPIAAEIATAFVQGEDRERGERLHARH